MCVFCSCTLDWLAASALFQLIPARLYTVLCIKSTSIWDGNDSLWAWRTWTGSREPQPKIEQAALDTHRKNRTSFVSWKKTEEMSKKMKTTNKETISPGNTHFWYPTTSCPNNKREKRNLNWYIKTYIKLSFDFDYTLCALCICTTTKPSLISINCYYIKVITDYSILLFFLSFV